MLFIDFFSIIAIANLSSRLTFLSRNEWLFLTDCNMPLSLITGFMAFVCFKKMRLPYIPLINIMGGSTFGVLLIHANSDTMRQWLWKDLLRNVEMYSSPWLVLHAFGSVLAIFIICVVIDRLRIRFVEPCMMACFDRLWPIAVKRFNSIETWFARKANFLIGE